MFLFRIYIYLYYFLDSTNKWYHIVFVFLWLSLSTIFSPSTLIIIMASIIMALFHCFLWLSNIPLCVRVCVCVCVCVYHIFLIQSSVDGHLGCFPILALVKIVLLWTWGCMHVFALVFSFFPDIYPEVELLDHMVVLFLIFWGTSILSSIVAAPIYIPTNSIAGFPFLHILTNICYL